MQFLKRKKEKTSLTLKTKKKKERKTVVNLAHSTSSPEIHPAELAELERQEKLKQQPQQTQQQSEQTQTQQTQQDDVLMIEVPVLCRAQALSSYKPQDFVNTLDGEITFLQFEKDEIIDVIDQDESGWWEGISNGTLGVFPSTYVKILETFTEKEVMRAAYIGRDDDRLLSESPRDEEGEVINSEPLTPVENGHIPKEINEKQEKDITGNLNIEEGPVVIASANSSSQEVSNTENNVSNTQLHNNIDEDDDLDLIKDELFNCETDEFENSIQEVISDILNDNYTSSNNHNNSKEYEEVLNLGNNDFSDSIMNEISELQMENNILKIHLSTISQNIGELKADFSQLANDCDLLKESRKSPNKEGAVGDSQIKIDSFIEEMRSFLANNEDSRKELTLSQSRNKELQNQIDELRSLYQNEKKQRISTEEKIMAFKREFNDYKILNQNYIQSRNHELQLELNLLKEDLLKFKLNDKISILKTNSSPQSTDYSSTISDLQEEIARLNQENSRLKTIPKISETLKNARQTEPFGERKIMKIDSPPNPSAKERRKHVPSDVVMSKKKIVVEPISPLS